MHVAKTNPLLATAATVSTKGTSGTTPSSSDFSAALLKLSNTYSQHLQSSNNKSDSGSGSSYKHAHSQAQDSSSNSSTQSNSHTDSKSDGNASSSQQQQTPVTMSMLGKPTSVVFTAQPLADAAAVTVPVTPAPTDFTSPVSTTPDATTAAGLSGLSNNKSTPVTGLQSAILNAIQSGASTAGTIPTSTFPNGTLQAGTLQPGTFGNGIVENAPVQPGTFQADPAPSALLPSGLLQSGAPQSGAGQFSPAQSGPAQPPAPLPISSPSDGTDGAILATGDDASSDQSIDATTQGSGVTNGLASLNSGSTPGTPSLAADSGNTSTIDPTGGDSDTLFGPTQDDSSAPSTLVPTIPTTFVPGDNSVSTVLAGAQPQPAPVSTFTPSSDVTAAGALAAASPTFTGMAPVSAVGALTTSPISIGSTPSSSAGVLAAVAQAMQSAQPATQVTSQPANQAANQSEVTPAASLNAPTPTGGHNQIAVGHGPVQPKPVTSPVSTSPVPVAAQPTSDPSRININNGLIQAPATKPTGPKHADSPVNAANGNQNTSIQGTGDSASAATPVAANGTASPDNNTGSDNSDSDSSDSKDRSKDEVIAAVSTATAAQAPVAQIMPATAQVQAAATVQPQPVVATAASTSHVPGSVNTKSADLETASISDTKSVINTSKLMQTVNQSEMRVGMRSAEFGDISIRASATHDSILTQIQVDHPELASSLATHIPDMQARLASHGNVEVQINHTSSTSTATDSGSSYQGTGSQGSASQSGRQQDGNSSNSYFSNSYGNASYGNSALPTAAAVNTLQNAGYDGRLDLQA